MLKKLKQKIESKRRSRNTFWIILVKIKDFVSFSLMIKSQGFLFFVFYLANNINYLLISKRFEKKDHPIQALWIGDELSKIEMLSIKSFLKNGHELHLYCYEKIKNVPEGTIIKDANEIISKEEIFKPYQHFSDLFRYKLLYEKAGFWVDLDTICLKHFDFNQYYAFSFEVDWELIAGGIIYANRKNDRLFLKLYNKAKDILKEGSKNHDWAFIGPRLLTLLTKKSHLFLFAKSSSLFYLINGHQKFFEPFAKIPQQCYSVHVGNSILTGVQDAYGNKILHKESKNEFDKTSILGILWEKYK